MDQVNHSLDLLITHSSSISYHFMLIETHLYAHVCLYTHPPTHGYLKTVSNFNSYLVINFENNNFF